MELTPEDVNIVAHDIDKVRALVTTFPFECVVSLNGVNQLFDDYRGHVDIRIDRSLDNTLTIQFGLVKRYGQARLIVDSRGWVTKTEYLNMDAGLVIDVFSALVSHLNA